MLILLMFAGLQTGLYAEAGAWIGEKYVGLFVDDSPQPTEKPRKRDQERERRRAQ